MGKSWRLAMNSEERPLRMRVDVFRGRHRILGERFDRAHEITVGAAMRNDLVLPDDEAPASLALFHRHGRGYALHFTDETIGSLRPRAGADWTELKQLRPAASVHKRGYDLDLEEGAVGRVEVGRETVVFEVAASTPAGIARARDFLAPVAIVLFGLLVIGSLIWMGLMLWRTSPPQDRAEPAASSTAATPASAPPLELGLAP
jgi:hypothetical protein